MSDQIPTANTPETGLVPISEKGLDRITEHGLSMPQTREQAEILREMLESEAAIETMLLDNITSRNLLGVPVTVKDALFTDIKDDKAPGGVKKCVRFLVIRQDTGEVVTCLKSSNTFNDSYVTFFDKWRGYDRQLTDLEFVEDSRWTFAGNAAIVLRKIKPVEKAVSGKK